MLRISRMADYGVVLATRLATLSSAELRSVSALAAETGLAPPTVAKVLKALTRASLIDSVRGARGGYRLSRPASAIHVAAVIAAIEGPIGVTECGMETDDGDCELTPHCDVRGNWQLINLAILSALEGVTLEQMARPAGPALITLGRARTATERAEEVPS